MVAKRSMASNFALETQRHLLLGCPHKLHTRNKPTTFPSCHTKYTYRVDLKNEWSKSRQGVPHLSKSRSRFPHTSQTSFRIACKTMSHTGSSAVTTSFLHPLTGRKILFSRMVKANRFPYTLPLAATHLTLNYSSVGTQLWIVCVP